MKRVYAALPKQWVTRVSWLRNALGRVRAVCALCAAAEACDGVRLPAASQGIDKEPFAAVAKA